MTVPSRLFCYSRPWGASNLIYVRCPGCRETHAHKVNVKEDLSQFTIGLNLGYFEAPCKNDKHQRRNVEGYTLIYGGVDK